MFTKTHAILALTIVIAIGNAVVPFMPMAIGAEVTTVLLVLAGVFNIHDVKLATADGMSLAQGGYLSAKQ